MATSWGAGREVHSGSSSLTSTADMMEEQHQPQADSSHQHWIRPHRVASCKDCASEALHHDSTVKRIAIKLHNWWWSSEEIRFQSVLQWIVSMHRMHSRVVGETTRSRALSGSPEFYSFALREQNTKLHFSVSSNTRAFGLLHQFVGSCAHLHRTGRRGAENEELWKRAAPPPFCVAAREYRGIPLYLATKLRHTPAMWIQKLMKMQLQTSKICGTRLSEKHG